MRLRVISAFALAASLALAATALGLVTSGETRLWATTAGWAIAGLAFGGAALAAAIRVGPGRLRTAWLFWATASAFWVAGAVGRGVLGAGTGSLPASTFADVLWCLFAVVSTAGIAVRSPRGLFSFPLYALDALPVVLLAAGLAQLTVTQDSHPFHAHDAFALAYPIAFVFLALVSTHFVTLQGFRQAWRRGSVFFVGGFYLLAAGAVTWGTQALDSSTVDDSWPGLFWTLGLLTLAAYAVFRALTPNRATPFYASEREGGRRSMPPVGALAGLALLEFLGPAATQRLAQGLLLAAMVAFGLRVFLVRQGTGRLLDALAAERDFTSAVIETAGSLVCVSDREGRFVRFNRACEELSGYTREEVIGRPSIDLVIPPEEQEAVAARIARVHAGDFPNQGENHWRTRGGELRLISWSNTALLDSKGEVEYVVSNGIDVTEVKEAQAGLAAAEGKYRRLVEQLPLVTYTTSFERPQRLLFIGPQIEPILGYSVEELLESPQLLEASLHPEDRDRVVGESTRWRAEGGEYLGEYRCVGRDGRVVWFEDTSVIVRDEAGEPLYVQGYLLDVTERKRAQVELERSSERFRLVALTVADAICDWDLQTNRLEWSDGMTTIFGYPRDEIESSYEWWLDRVHPEDRERVHAEVQAAIAARVGEYSWEYRWRAHDDGYREVWDRGLRVPGSDRLIGGVADVSERKRAESALREAEERYRTLVEQVPAIVYSADEGATGAWHYASPQIESILGFTADEWMADPGLWAARIHPDDRERVHASEAADVELGRETSIEYRLLARDGRVVWVRDQAVPVRDESKALIRFHGFLLDITEQKQAEERYQALVEQLPAITYTAEIGLDGRWLYVSPQIETMLGGRSQDWLADPQAWLESVHPDDRALVEAYETNAATLEGEFRNEYRMIATDGRVVWVRDEATIVTDETGAPCLHHGLLFDVTAEKEAEEQLRKAEDQYRTLVEELPAIVYTTEMGTEGEWLYVSPQIETIVGVPRNEWLGSKDTWLRHVHPDDRGRLVAFEHEGSADGAVLDYRLVASDGRVVWVQDHVTVVRDESGVPRWYQGFMLDVTEKRQAEDALRETSEMLESLIDASPVAVMALDRDAVVTLWNPSAERTFGWTREEALGSFNPVVSGAERAEFLRLHARALQGESWRDREIVRRRKDGSPIELSVSSGPMRSASGEIVGMVSLIVDVTERKLAEAERERLVAALSEQNERLRELDRLKDEFVALVSHELRTPLTSIRGYLELIMDGEVGDVTPEQAEFLGIVDRNALRLLRLVGDLLLVAQIGSGAMNLSIGEVDLPSLAAEAVAAAAPAAEKKEISLTLEAAKVPALQADRSRLAQALDNFLSNAIKFTPPGGRITVRLERLPGAVAIEISDTGMGMTPEEKELLFQRFFRTEEATRQAIPGTGLGLTITKGIVEAHGGTVSVESRKGAGTTFRVILPNVASDRGSVQNAAMEEAA